MILKKNLLFIVLIGLLAGCISAPPTQSEEDKLSENLGIKIGPLITDLHYLSENLTPSLRTYRTYSRAGMTPDNFHKIYELLDSKWRSSCRIPDPFISANDFLFMEIASPIPVWWMPDLALKSSIVGWQTDNGYIKLKYEESKQTLYILVNGNMSIACTQ